MAEVSAKKIILKSTSGEYLVPVTEPLIAGDGISIEDNVISATGNVIGSGGGNALFDVIEKDHILSFSESNGLALLGTYVYKEPVQGVRYGYSTFYNKCVAEYNTSESDLVSINGTDVVVYKNANGHKFYNISDKEIFDTLYELTGEAWYYGIDIENERIFLPRNDYIFYSGNKTLEVGSSIDAGLPNATGSVINMIGDPAAEQSGALTTTHVNNANHTQGGGGNLGWRTISLDLSRANSIYGNSDTVKMKGVQTLTYMVVGNTTVESATTNVTQITTTENDTLPQYYNCYSTVDMTTSGAFVNASLGTWLSGNLWTTVFNDLLGKVGEDFCAGKIKLHTATDITDYDCLVNEEDITFRLPKKNGSEVVPDYEAVHQITSGHVFTENAWLKIAGMVGQQTYYVNGINILGYIKGNAESYVVTVLFPVRKGDVVTWSTVTTGVPSVDTYPCKGEGSLYFKLNNVTQNIQILNVAGMTSALNLKADKVSAVDKVDTMWAIDACAPDYSAVITMSSSPFTAPAAGIAHWNNNGTYNCAVNGHTVNIGGNDDKNEGPATILLSKGDVLVWTKDMNNGCFIPLKGAK